MNDERRVGGERQGVNWKVWGAAVLAALLVIFVVANSQKVTIDFVFFEAETPLVFGLLVAGILGVAVGLLAPIVRRGRRAQGGRR